MPELHEELTALRVDWPATPDIAGAVSGAAASTRRRPPPAAAVAAAARLRPRRARRRLRAHDGRLARRALGGARVARAQEREDRAARAERAATAAGHARLRPRARHGGDARAGSPPLAVSCACRPRTGSDAPTRSTSAVESVSLVYGERAGYARSTDDRRRGARPGVPGPGRAVHPEGDRRGDASSTGSGSTATPRTSSPARTDSPTRATRTCASRSSGSPATRCSWSARTGC